MRGCEIIVNSMNNNALMRMRSIGTFILFVYLLEYGCEGRLYAADAVLDLFRRFFSIFDFRRRAQDADD